MDKIFTNIMDRSLPQKTKKPKKALKNLRPKFHFTKMEFGDNFQKLNFLDSSYFTIQPATSQDCLSYAEIPQNVVPTISRTKLLLSDNFI
jgi:hypothetical protein